MSTRAHRVLYAEEVGDPGDLYVCHACDNPSCVNPEHLWLGTAGDNARDREAKKRGNHQPGKKRGSPNSWDGGEPHAYLLRIETWLWLKIVARAAKKRWSINRTINEAIKDVTDE